MPVSARVCELTEIASFRQAYLAEMNCQVIHDSIHVRSGWSVEYLLEVDGIAAGYGSVAVAGPWKESHTLYEFYLVKEFRLRTFHLFRELLAACRVRLVETQTNDPFLSTLLNTFGHNIRAEAILFEDSAETHLQPPSAHVRPAQPGDVDQLKRLDLDDGAGWVVTYNGAIAGAGGVLYHYNRPYGDVYMKIAEPFRNRGLGAFLVQELKRACRVGGSVPAARCSVKNEASRRTLQKAGFVPCGNMITAELDNSPR